jgi:cytochrome bd-type quinol oxidase subunit 1
MERHMVLCWLHRVASALFLLSSGAWWYLMESYEEQLSSSLVVSILILLIPFIVVHAFLSWGAKNEKNWARMLSFALGIFYLLVFPIGTIFGIAMIFFSYKTWVREYANTAGAAE